MKAFVEHLSGIVRVGPDCDRYGKPFEYAVGFSSTDGRTAVVKALVTDGGLKQGHARAIINSLANIGLTATWERVRTSEDAMTAKKEPIHHTSLARDASGHVDQAIVVSHAKHALGQIEAGHVSVVDLGEEPLANGDVKRWFITRSA